MSKPIKTSCALVAALALSGQAAAAQPRPGADYHGRTSQGKSISLHVTANGHGLQMSFVSIYHCNRGPDKSSQGIYRKQRPSIGPKGRFDYRITYHLGPVPGFAEHHTERHHITGAFSPDAKTVHGQVTVTDIGKSGLRCASKLTFTAQLL